MPKKTILSAGFILLMLAVMSSGIGSASGAPAKRKCSSFASQKAAQKYFVRKGGSESNNVSGLDPDGDGLVCPDNPGPFAAYVEIGYAKGFFYGKVVCANYPDHRTKKELKEAEKASEEKKAPQCYSTVVEVDLKEVAHGPDPVVASHKAEASPEATLLPIGTSEKNVKGSILSFEWKLVPKKKSGMFYAVSEECFGTPSRKVKAEE